MATPISSPTRMSAVAGNQKLALTYERLRPLIIWLGLVELAWLAVWLLRPTGQSPTFTMAVASWAVLLVAWMAAVSTAGAKGLHLRQSRRLSNLIGTVFVVAFSVAWLTVLPAMRSGLLAAAGDTPDTQLIAFHILRLLAVGTMIKFWQGQLPRHFMILGSLPDLLFAVSAVVLWLVSMSLPLSPIFLLAWHVLGILAFAGAGIGMYLSVPSPIRVYHTRPDTSLVFQFPMLLAPNFTVPLFMLAHLFAILKIVGG